MPARPPSFCIGCPERPIFAAMKLVEQELGPHHIAGDIGCHLFASLPPFNIGATTMGYGLGPASRRLSTSRPTKSRFPSSATAAFGTTGSPPASPTPSTTSRTASSWSSQHVLLCGDRRPGHHVVARDQPGARDQQHHRRCGEGCRRQWVWCTSTALTTSPACARRCATRSPQEGGPKVIVASSECMLNKQRRVKPLFRSRCATASAWSASGSASTRMSAPAITPASDCRAVRRCRSSTPTIR